MSLFFVLSHGSCHFHLIHIALSRCSFPPLPSSRVLDILIHPTRSPLEPPHTKARAHLLTPGRSFLHPRSSLVSFLDLGFLASLALRKEPLCLPRVALFFPSFLLSFPPLLTRYNGLILLFVFLYFFFCACETARHTRRLPALTSRPLLLLLGSLALYVLSLTLSPFSNSNILQEDVTKPPARPPIPSAPVPSSSTRLVSSSFLLSPTP